MEKRMPVKAIVVDLDKTLLRTDKTLSAYTAKVLRECQQNSIKVMVATARPLRTTIQYCQAVNFDAITISNGAKVLSAGGLAEYKICTESAERILRGLLRHPSVRITLETGERAYSNLPISDYETILSDDLVAIAREEGVIKILVHLDDQDTQALVEKVLTEDVYHTIAHGYLLQIMDRSATKWNGIQAMLKICNCSAEQAAYFGDDQDDIEPIRECGLGIAVSNGIDAVKAVADHIAQSNDDDGVAKFIESMILANPWKTIGELTDQTVLGTDGMSKKPPLEKVRAIAVNGDGKIAVMFEEATDYYALPGGGIEAGEDAEAALIREMAEETGCICDSVKPLGVVLENRYHADVTRLTYFFVVHTKAEKSTMCLTDEEIALGTTVKWCSLQEVWQLIRGNVLDTDQKKFLQARDMAALAEYSRLR